MRGAKSAGKVEIDSNAKKTVQSAKSADKPEADLNTKKSDAEVYPFKISVILSVVYNQIIFLVSIMNNILLIIFAAVPTCVYSYTYICMHQL